MPSKRQLEAEVVKLQERLLAKDFAINTLESKAEWLENECRRANVELSDWRVKYELLLHTPEYKADTEAAFKRGESHSIRKFQNWLQSVTVTLPQTLQDSNEE